MNTVEGIKKITRTLGTNINSYLDDLFKSIEKNNFNNFNDWNEYRKKSIRYNEKEKNKDKSTIRQVKEFFKLLKIIDINDYFLLSKFNDEISFKLEIEEKLKEIIKNNNHIEDLKDNFKNIEKMYNNLIISNLIELNELNNREINKIKNNKYLMERLNQFNLKKWIKLKILKNEIISRAKKIFSRYEINDDIFYPLKDKNFNHLEIKKIKDFSYEAIENEKKELKSEIWNVFQFIDKKISNEKLVIPFFQREYVWKESLIEDLIKSIISFDSYLNIGSFLIRNNKIHNDSSAELIDGQQRVTSLLMIINYISKKINNTKYNINNKDLIINSSKIKNIENKSDNDYTNSLNEVLDIKIKEIDKRNNKNNSIKKNYLIIHNLLSNYLDEELFEIYKKLNFVFLILISDNKSNSIDLFINMNSKRKELSNYDLIKSFLIKEINENMKNSLNKKINDLSFLFLFNEEKIDDKKINIFFELFITYINIKNNEKISIEYNFENIFKNIQIIYEQYYENKIEEFINDIIYNLESYRILKDIDENKYIYLKDFRISLSNKKNLKQGSIYNIFLIEFINELRKILKNINNEKDKTNYYSILNEIRKTLMLIEKFEIKWKIINFSGDSLTKLIRNIFKKFIKKRELLSNEDKNIYDNVFEEFKNIIKEDKNNFFYEIVYEKPDELIIEYKNKIVKDAIIEKILYRVSFNLYNNSSCELSKDSNDYYDIKNSSIEHIFPKNYKKWLKENEKNTNELKNYLENIGNKLIFNKNENSKLGNNLFNEKLKKYKTWNEFKKDETYQNSEYNINNLKIWTKEDVEKRENFILNSLIKTWSKI